MTSPSLPGHARVPAARALQRGIDVLVVALALVAVVAAWLAAASDAGLAGGREARPVLATVLAAALVAAYGIGAWRAAHRPGRPTTRDAVGWVASLGALWAALLVAEPAGLWLAFPLMFLELHVLGRRAGPVAVAGTTVLAVVAALARGQNPVGSVLGPVLGACVAVGVVLGFEAVARESSARARVIGELEGTRAHLAAAERAQAVAVERERLAREIHDTLAQGFSSVELLLRAADEALARGDVGRGRELVETTRSEALRNLAEARRVVRDLAPADLEASTLAAALRRVAARTAEGGGPRVDVELTGEPRPVPVPVETAFLRIAQSALANALQHADASRVAVTLSFLDDAGDGAGLALDVVDDGRGFEPAAAGGAASPGSRTRQAGLPGGRPGPAAPSRAPRSGGFGLVAMRSRLRELGGTLVVESAPGRGTAVSARVPLELVTEVDGR